MEYEKTIKKAKYKYYIEFPISDILNYCLNWNNKKYAKNWLEVEDDEASLNLNDYIYKQGFDGLYNNEGMLDEALTHLRKVTRVNKLNSYIEDIKSDILRACSDSYCDNYIHEAFNKVKGIIKDKIEELISDNSLNSQILYYSNEDKTLHSEFMYNSDYIRVYAPKKVWAEWIKKEFDDYTFEEGLAEIPYTINLKDYAVNWEYIDYYGTMGHYDNWLEYFTEYNEVGDNILAEAKRKQSKTKAYIKNQVPILKRK